ncbi:arsenate reductase family protein [Gorillibacterium timonense]|uniref:arsenate reductase family protein n=1 Tax=Gorillibacterium timonense TaxID=1689269 RepID=UPI00071DCC9E|nr:arsenate reductase family protein [Gorillibacterium timonense]
MSLTFYWYPKCGTCRKAKQWLEAAGQSLDAIDLFQTPPSAEELGKLVELSGLDSSKFFNTSGEVYRELKLKDKLPGMSLEEKLMLLAGNGRLIKRPLVTDGSRVTVGFKEEDYEKVWGSGGR